MLNTLSLTPHVPFVIYNYLVKDFVFRTYSVLLLYRDTYGSFAKSKQMDACKLEE